MQVLFIGIAEDGSIDLFPTEQALQEAAGYDPPDGEKNLVFEKEAGLIFGTATYVLSDYEYLNFLPGPVKWAGWAPIVFRFQGATARWLEREGAELISHSFEQCLSINPVNGQVRHYGVYSFFAKRNPERI